MSGKWTSAGLLALTIAAWGCGKDEPPQQAAGGEPAVKVQTTCPVMGGNVNKDLYVDHEGKRVYFCCTACIAEFKKDPGKYVTKLQAEGVVLEDAPASPGHAHEHGQ